jgi:enamine deaminase RidA (YjgF/YER057c/UK114 family)
MTETSFAEQRLAALGFSLPPAPAAGGNYVAAKRVGVLLHLSGVISSGPDGVISGTAGVDRTIDDGYAAARACALTQLAVLKRELGSDLLIQVFGEPGRHVRAAVGVNALPRNALVELQMTVRVNES